jgi:hypothetical protein
VRIAYWSSNHDRHNTRDIIAFYTGKKAYACCESQDLNPSIPFSLPSICSVSKSINQPVALRIVIFNLLLHRKHVVWPNDASRLLVSNSEYREMFLPWSGSNGSHTCCLVTHAEAKWKTHARSIPALNHHPTRSSRRDLTASTRHSRGLCGASTTS